MTLQLKKAKYSGVVQLQRVGDYKLAQARSLRKRMTPAEKALWAALRGKRVGTLKFRRQQVIEGFIADFFCPQHNLVIEVDGPIHETAEQKEIDCYRRKVFESRGLREIRFTNNEVFTDMAGVVQRIISLCE